MKTIYLAGGCFWGMQKFIDQFDGVLKTETGYANGPDSAPSYQEVCNDSGHAETVRIDYDEERISLRKLLDDYFMVIDPFSFNRQGHDEGIQYRTGVYYTDEADVPVIREKFREVEKENGRELAVELLPLVNFFSAEEYHQKYLDKNPGGYCHIPDAMLKIRKPQAGDELLIGVLRLKNRITMAPTVKFGWAGADGKVSDLHVEHYRARAEHGAGLITVEATAVTPEGRFGENHLGLYTDEQIEGQKRITEACHEFGTPVLIQLNHTGITGNPLFGTPAGPSEVETRSGARSHALTVPEIHAVQQAFTDAAVRAKKAGYDGVQLHGCHSYLINQFICRTTNLRMDEYGGSVENMARFGSEIISMIRKACGPDFLISVRTSGADPSEEEALLVAEEYLKAGCDYLQVSSGITSPNPEKHDSSLPYNEITGLGVKFHAHFQGRVPVSCVNRIMTPEDARYLIENGLTDTVDLGRGLLADPAFTEAILYGKDYVRCFECARCQYGPSAGNRCPAALKRKASS